MKRNNKTDKTGKNLTELYGENLWKNMKDVVNFKSDDPSHCRYFLGDTAIVELKNGDTLKFVITQVEPMCIRMDASGFTFNPDDCLFHKAEIFPDALADAMYDVKCSANGRVSIFICKDSYYRLQKKLYGFSASILLFSLFFTLPYCISLFVNQIEFSLTSIPLFVAILCSLVLTFMDIRNWLKYLRAIKRLDKAGEIQQL